MATPNSTAVPLYKVVLVGDIGVGKTSVYTRYQKDFFDPIRTPTFGVDNFIEELYVDEKRCRLNIWDTAGLERTGSLTSHYYHSAQAVALLYAVDELNSLNIILHWIEDAERYAPYAAKFLVANKIDLDKDDWEVEEMKAQLFMESNNIIMKYNVSAKTGEGIKEMFEDISRYLMQQKVAPTMPHGDPFHLSHEDSSLDLRKQKQFSLCSC
ncbi:ras-related protein Rab-18-B-like [Actinia tenebrosa]|uniref:Ras-related protein Rab-18-B-like n=1 Tax=Actinia tenebrosa TaxID=6105 RepID=A0A6P8IGB5_ACTTE|nr:ras-related protein Rab-18-B-like [Actinia tenebrosa]